MILNLTRRFNFIFLLAVLCLVSCEKDEFDQVEKELVFPKLSGRIITPKEMTNDPAAYDGLMKYLSQPVAKSHSGIELDTTHINVIDTDQYTSYTFKIKQDSLERQYLLKNFMLTVVNDTTLIQHLIEYPVLGDGSINMEGSQWQRLYGDDLLDVSLPKCGGTTTVWYSYQSCYSIPCIGEGDDKHEYGEPCQLDGRFGAPQLRCVTRWGSMIVNEEPCASIDNGNDGRATGGAIPPDLDPIDEEIVVPANPTDPDSPDLCISDGNGGCVDPDDGDEMQLLDPVEQELNDLIHKDTTFVNVKQIITLLKTKTSESVEYSMSFYKAFVDTAYVTKPYTPSIERGTANFSPVYIGRWEFASIHTHQQGKHAMFSFQDVYRLSDMYNTLSPIIREKAVMIIVTASGEVYALKVSDINKLNAEMTAALNAQTKFNTQQDKLDELTRLLGIQYDTDLNNLEGIFASTFKNFGVSLYKANDANLSGWTKTN